MSGSRRISRLLGVLLLSLKKRTDGQGRRIPRLLDIPEVQEAGKVVHYGGCSVVYYLLKFGA